MKRLFLLALLLFLAACANQRMYFHIKPSDATTGQPVTIQSVRLDGLLVAVKPSTEFDVDTGLQVNTPLHVQIEAPGYEPYTVVLSGRYPGGSLDVPIEMNPASTD